MSTEPLLTYRSEGGRDAPLLVWRFPTPLRAISSAALGGGVGERGWVVNATIDLGYERDDPDVHLAELARDLGLGGAGIGLLTGVDVADVVRTVDAGVVVWSTVGLGTPLPAAAPADAAPVEAGPGTVNVVAYVPVRFGDAALVNAVATVTEAKAQAMAELGLAATGTPSDAVAVLCPPDGPVEAYGGPRSRWGARLARAVHAGVLDRGGAYLRSGLPWSVRVTEHAAD